MIAAIDGNVDETERLFLLNISEQLGSGDPATSHQSRLEAAERYRAFMWLLCEKDTYEKDIFDGIRFLIQENEQTGEHVKNMLWGMAEASEGVSESESNEILRITEALGIADTLN
jgi:tellurite resistance protein